MSDAMTELFTAALGLGAPWQVEQVRFEAHEIHFDVICAAKRLPCPRCAARISRFMIDCSETGSICISSSTAR